MQNERENVLREIMRILRDADVRKLRMVWRFVQGMK